MAERKQRAPRAGAVKPRVGPPAALDRAGVQAIKEAALSSGPEYLLRDLDRQRQAHLAAGEEDDATSAHALGALALAAAAAWEEVAQMRKAADLPDVNDFAIEMPNAAFPIPIWALAAIATGWARARFGDVAEDGQRSGPMPLVEAFGLGKAGGDRTIAARHIARDRDLNLAIAVAEMKARAPSVSDNIAFNEVAAAQGSTEPTVRRAWGRYGERAREIVARAAGSSNPGSL